jgi:hypothetical protein
MTNHKVTQVRASQKPLSPSSAQVGTPPKPTAQQIDDTTRQPAKKSVGGLSSPQCFDVAASVQVARATAQDGPASPPETMNRLAILWTNTDV